MMMKQAEKKQQKIYTLYVPCTQFVSQKTQLYFCTLSCNLKRIIIIFLPKISCKKYKPVLCNASLSPFRNSKYSSHFLFNFFCLFSNADDGMNSSKHDNFFMSRKSHYIIIVPAIIEHSKKNKATLFTIKSSHNVFFSKFTCF